MSGYSVIALNLASGVIVSGAITAPANNIRTVLQLLNSEERASIPFSEIVKRSVTRSKTMLLARAITETAHRTSVMYCTQQLSRSLRRKLVERNLTATFTQSQSIRLIALTMALSLAINYPLFIVRVNQANNTVSHLRYQDSKYLTSGKKSESDDDSLWTLIGRRALQYTLGFVSHAAYHIGSNYLSTVLVAPLLSAVFLPNSNIDPYSLSGRVVMRSASIISRMLLTPLDVVSKRAILGQRLVDITEETAAAGGFDDRKYSWTADDNLPRGARAALLTVADLYRGSLWSAVEVIAMDTVGRALFDFFYAVLK